MNSADYLDAYEANAKNLAETKPVYKNSPVPGVSISAMEPNDLANVASNELSKLSIASSGITLGYNSTSSVSRSEVDRHRFQLSLPNVNDQQIEAQEINTNGVTFPPAATSLVGLFHQPHCNPATTINGLPYAGSFGSNMESPSPCDSRPSTPANFVSPYALPSFPLSPSDFLRPHKVPHSLMFMYQTPPPTPPFTPTGYRSDSQMMSPPPNRQDNFFEFPPRKYCNTSPNTSQYRPTEYSVPQSSSEDGLTAREGGRSSPHPGSTGGGDSCNGIKAVVEAEGYISLHLRCDVHVDIAPNQGIRIVNNRKGITMALSGCGTSMALVHPQGRALQYNARIEVQTEDGNGYRPSIKNAKMWPRGVSFTANNYALVYLVDQAGARSTTDTFHDLYASNIADSVFLKSCEQYYYSGESMSPVERSISDLEAADYWRTEGTDLDCWVINSVSIKQTPDGLVSVERKHGEEVFTLKTSPSNGKARLQSSFLYLTASMGEESHLFVKSNDRRIHYNGKAFVVRNAGHSAGFDDEGQLRIW